MLIQEYLINSAEKFPEKEAIVQPNRRVTYGEALAAARSVAQWLRSNGIKPGDRVAILMDDPSEYIMSYFGILMAGGIVVAMNTQTSARTLNHVINNCRASALVTHAKFVKYLKEIATSLPTITVAAVSSLGNGSGEALSFPCIDFSQALAGASTDVTGLHTEAEISDSAVAQIIYTSGTTGESKGVMLSHRNLMANAASIIEYLKLGSDERHMVVLPFFYSYGNSILLTHFAVGATLVVNQSLLYPKIVLEMMLNEKVTGFSGVPSNYAILLNRSPIRDYAFPSLRYLAQAGGAMSPKLARELKDILPNVDIYIMYGQTEASARLSFLEPMELERKSGSIGKAIPGVTLSVLSKGGEPVKTGETGEIVAQGDNVMVGYWEDSEKTSQVLRKEGLWTGDLARVDDEGFLYIVSRKSDMIKSGAHRIAPKEIEEVILEHMAVHEVAVFGIEDDDEILGEVIKAAVVLKQGSECSKRELLAHCRRNLPAFKVPQHLEFIDELLKTSSGKVKKHELKKTHHSAQTRKKLRTNDNNAPGGIER